LAAALTACTPLDVLNMASGSSRYRTQADVAYGDLPRQTLDLYSPESNAEGCRILFVYGGSWRDGDKRDYGFVGAAFARYGYEVAIPDYRVYPAVTFPAFVEDIAQSIVWYQKQDPRPLVLMGHSAGALIAALASFDPHYLEEKGGHPQEIQALITLAGPHDYFLPTEKPQWTVIFGDDPQQQVNALPVRHVTSEAPPTLILHGLKDDIVTPRSAHSLSDALNAHGVANQVKLYPKLGHRRLMASVAPPLQFLAPTMNDILEFLQSQTCHSTQTPSLQTLSSREQ